MEFRLGAIPEDDFEPDDSWQALHEPGPWLMQLLAVPIGIALLVSFVLLWQQCVPTKSLTIPKGWELMFGIATIASLPLLVFVHELLHAAGHPGFGLRPATIIGAWPQKMLFYAHYRGVLTRNSFLAIFALPFVVISVMPLAIGALGLLPPATATIMAWFSIWNALFACGDVFGFFLILSQVPADSILRNKGWRTYWKPI